jgi:hypothetical protein
VSQPKLRPRVNDDHVAQSAFDIHRRPFTIRFTNHSRATGDGDAHGGLAVTSTRSQKVFHK